MRLTEITRKTQRLVGIGIVAVALVVGLASSARATLVDLDGGGGATGAVNVGSFDWNFTSFLAQGGVQAITNFAGGCTNSCDFNVLTHASLSSVSDLGGNTIAVGGLNSSYEITMIAKYTETVNAVGANFAQFSVNTNQPIVLEIYYDPTRDSNALNGSGFNDGTLILSGTLVQSATGFFLVTDTDPALLDQSSDGNQYGNQATVEGTGSSSSIAVGGLTVDPTFFIQALDSFGIQFSNISIGLPFDSTNPSVCFNTSGTGTAVGSNTVGTLQCSQADQDDGANYAGQTITTDGGYVPQVGAVNGLAGFGPDFIAQTDFNSPLSAAVPEPGSLLLFGFGLLGISGYLRSRNRKTK